MIKVESNMLVLDNSFSKEDVLAIDEFVQIAKQQERESIIKALEQLFDKAENGETRRLLSQGVALIREKK